MSRKKRRQPAGEKTAPTGAKVSRPGKTLDSAGQHWSFYVMIGLIAVMAFGTFLFWGRSILFLLRPYTQNYSEDSILVSALELAAGRNPYSPERYLHLPAILTPYPPLYYILNAAFLKITGISFLPGRLISFLSSFGISTVIFLTINRETRNRLASVIGALAFLALYPTVICGAVLRVDNLTLLLAISGLYVGTAKQMSAKSTAAALILLLLSIFTKQSSVAALMVVVLCLWQDNRGSAIRFAGIFVAAWLAIFFFMYAISHGGYIYNTVTSLSTNPITWERFWSRTSYTFMNIKNAVFLLLIIFALLFKRIKLDRWALYAALAMAECLLTVGKFGSGPNYFLEPAIGMAILIGLFAAQLHAAAREDKGLGLAVVGLIILGTVVFGYNQEKTLAKQTWLGVSKGRFLKVLTMNSNEILQNSKPGDLIVTKRVDLAFLNGRVPAMNDPFTFSFMANTGKWDQSEIVGLLKAGSVPLVIIDKGVADFDSTEFLSEAMKAAVKSRYKLFAIIDDIYYYAPI